MAGGRFASRAALPSVCLLLVHHRVRDDAPLVLLANRDESYDRPFGSPASWPGPEGIVAPRDARGGGTWLGVNAAGLVVAITNRPSEAPRHGARSRGLLVADLLRARDADDARHALLAAVLCDRYEPFNLLLVDRDRAFAVEDAPAATRVTALTVGVHVMSNLHDLDSFPIPRGGEARVGEPFADTLARLESLATDREPTLPGGHSICKVGLTRGTVCSAVVALAPDPGRAPTFRFAAGPPHVTPFHDVA